MSYLENGTRLLFEFCKRHHVPNDQLFGVKSHSEWSNFYLVLIVCDCSTEVKNNLTHFLGSISLILINIYIVSTFTGRLPFNIQIPIKFHRRQLHVIEDTLNIFHFIYRPAPSR